MGNIREATKAFQKAIVEEVTENKARALREENAKLKAALKSRRIK